MITSCYDKWLFCVYVWCVWRHSARQEIVCEVRQTPGIGEEGHIMEPSGIRPWRAGSICSCDCWTVFNFLWTVICLLIVIFLWTGNRPSARTVPSNCTVPLSLSPFNQLSICETLLRLIDSLFVYRLYVLFFM